MSPRSAVRGIALATAAAAIAVVAAVALSPRVRHRVLALGRRGTEPEAQQPTHIVLPDRASLTDWEELDEAIEEGREVASDIALTGA